jgi:hypothetical protein
MLLDLTFERSGLMIPNHLLSDGSSNRLRTPIVSSNPSAKIRAVNPA